MYVLICSTGTSIEIDSFISSEEKRRVFCSENMRMPSFDKIGLACATAE